MLYKKLSEWYMNSGHETFIEIEQWRPRWLPFFADEYFVPRFRITVENKFPRIARASLSIEIAQCDDVHSIQQLEVFQSVHELQIDEMEQGERRELNFAIRSRFLKPGRYALQIVLTRFDLPDTPDQANLPPGFMRMVPYGNGAKWRSLELFRVYPVLQVLPVYGGGVTALGTAIAYGFQLV